MTATPNTPSVPEVFGEMLADAITGTNRKPLDGLTRVLQESHMTAIVDTQSGSRYTVVARPAAGVILIHDTDGWARQGSSVMVVADRLHLVKGERVLWQTTPITHINILSN